MLAACRAEALVSQWLRALAYSRTVAGSILAHAIGQIAGVHSAVIEYLHGVKPVEGKLGAGPGLTPVPLARPKDQSSPGPRSRRWALLAKRSIS